MNRGEFQHLANVRIAEAQALLKAKKYDGAYYLAGYAVECALKACIAKMTKEHDFPPPKKIVDDCYSHDLDALLRVCGLKADRDDGMKTNPALAANWLVVKDWNERARYATWSKGAAKKLCRAIADKSNGVMQWIRARW